MSLFWIRSARRGQNAFRPAVECLEDRSLPSVNTAPLLGNLAITSPLAENGQAALSGTITDPDAADSFELRVDWGDGSVETFIYGPGTTSFSETHLYTDDNPTGTGQDTFNIELRLTDNQSSFYALTNNGGVWIVDLASGTPTLVGSTGVSQVTELEFDPSTGRAWVQGGQNGVLGKKGQEINLARGQLVGTPIANVPSSLNFPGMEFFNGSLYGDNNPAAGASPNLYILDPATGSTQLVVTLQLPTGQHFSGLAFDPVAQVLYGIRGSSSPSSNFYRIDPATGQVTLIGSTNFAMSSLEFGTDGLLYAGTNDSGASNGSLFRIDPATGAATFVCAISPGVSVSGLTIATATDVQVLSLTVQNAPPVADASFSQPAYEGSTVNLTGSFTDAGTLDAHSFQWHLVSSSTGQTVPDGAGQSFGFVPSDNGTYTFDFTVTDDDGGSDTATVVVNVGNVAPTLTIAGRAVTREGAVFALNLASFDPGDDTIDHWTIHWGDGHTETVPGNTSTITHVYANGPRAHTIRATATDEDGTFLANQLRVTVRNVAPTVSVSGPARGVRGQGLVFRFRAHDVPADEAARFTYRIDWNGDGRTDQVVRGASTVNLRHAFSDAGRVAVRVRVTDRDGATSRPAAHAVAITPLALQADPSNPSATALVIGGTTGDDTIGLEPGSAPGRIRVWINGVFRGTFAPTGHLIVFGQAGNDLIEVASGIRRPAWLHGGAGNDVLRGGSAADALLGDGGRDLLFGGPGRDLLGGGSGQDSLFGGSQDDLVIGNRTAFDPNHAAIAAILAEWTSSRGYTARVNNLRGTGSGPAFNARRNANFFLSARTVPDDRASDFLFGEAGRDLFFASRLSDVVFMADRTEMTIR